MPYRELTMIDVREVLRRWQAGQSHRKIARETGTDRGTAGRYIRAAQQLGLSSGCEITDVEVHEVAQCVQSRPIVSPSEEWSAIAKHKERIAEWLGRKRPLRLRKVHTLLVRKHGLEANYDTLLRFAR